MRRVTYWLFAILLLVSLLLSGCGDWSRARYNRSHGAFSAQDLLAQRPWLQDVTPDWHVQIDYSQALPGFAALAGFPLGNGHVFAATGLRYPLGTLENLLGPTYQKTGGTFGQVIPALEVGGQTVNWRQQAMTWVRPGGMVRTISGTSDGLSLTTYDYVPPDLPAVVRIAVVDNQSQGRSFSGISLAHAFSAPATAAGSEVQLGTASAGMRAGYLDSRAEVTKQFAAPLDLAQTQRDTAPGLNENSLALRCPLGKLGPGQSVVKIFYLIVTTPQDDGSATLAKLRAGLTTLDATHQYWQQRAEQTVQVTGPDTRLNDFLQIEKYLCQVQQAAGGGFSPMHGYTKCWIRDSNGPVRYLTSCGDFEAVKRHLQYQFAGYARQGKVSNNLTLDLPLTGPVPAVDWEKAPAPGAEIASFMILQRYWYWLATGDNDLIREQWPMLRRCLLAQRVDERGTLPFFGDETFRFPGYELFGAGRPAPDWLCMQTQSLDSCREYVVAARGLAEMAAAIGHAGEVADYQARAERVRAAVEKYFWQPDHGLYAPALSPLTNQVQQNPFAPVNLHCWWLGYPGDLTRQQSDLTQTLRYLAKPSGTLLSTPLVGYYVPMTPGYLVYALAATDHPARGQALEALLNAAEASGGYAEMNTPEDVPSAAVWGLHRFRPWEGGLNADAALYALTGLQVNMPLRRVTLRPWLPPGSPGFTVTNLAAGKCRLKLEVTPTGCTVTRGPDEDPQPLTVVLRGLPAPVSLAPGQSVKASLALGATAKLAPAVPFTWSPPATGARQVLLTWDPQTVAAHPGHTVLDTRLTWPISYLKQMLLDAKGQRRADAVLADVGWPGAFRRDDYWTQGEGGQLLAEFEKAGGKVQRLDTGRRLSDAVPDI
ncbi:MAG TPA: hypothetical protein VGM19_13375 [Armatimonadota bacterium]|jgi:hypothetical protein